MHSTCLTIVLIRRRISSYENFPPIAPFLRYGIRKLQNRYIWLPLLRLNPPTEGCPWDDLRKIVRGCQWMAKVPNGKEKLPKISTGWVRCTNCTDRQMTDGRTGDNIANENVSSRSLTTELGLWLWARIQTPETPTSQPWYQVHTMKTFDKSNQMHKHAVVYVNRSNDLYVAKDMSRLLPISSPTSL